MSISAILLRLVLALGLAYLLGSHAPAEETHEAMDTSPGSEASFILSREQSLLQQARQSARETALVQQAVQKTPTTRAHVPDEIRTLLIREAMLVTAATEPPVDKGPKFDRVTFAERMVNNNDYRMAVSLLKDIVQSVGATEEERARAQLLLAQISLHQGRSSDAVVELSTWLGEFPRRRESPFVYFLLGQAYRDLGAYEQARDNFYRVLSSSLVAANSSDTNASFSKEKKLVRAAVWQLAETEYERKNWDRSLTYFDRFNSQNPSGDQLVEASLYRRADCLYQLRRNDEAVTGYEKALSVAPFHPFAPEAWLRLYFLYGETHQIKKQADAMRALAWTVNTLQPNRLAYWQQRGVGMLMELPRENSAQLVELRDSLKSRASDEGWKPIYAYLTDICSRITLDKAPATVAAAPTASSAELSPVAATVPTAGTPQSADEWAQWKEEYTRRREQLQEQAQPWLDKTPVGDTKKKPQGSQTEG